MLSDGLKIFRADVVDEFTDTQAFWNVVAKTYDEALKMFIKEANDVWDIYYYHFYELEDKDEVETFLEYYENVVEGIYEL